MQGKEQNTGWAGKDTLTNFENLIGGRFEDELIGDEFDNVLIGLGGGDILTGGMGADTLNGGIGNDTASYVSSTSGVTVSLLTGKGTGGEAESDQLFSIEYLIGSSKDDVLTGNSANNKIDGGDGNDTIDGAGGNDILTAGKGLAGGTSDTASYASASAGVTVSLMIASAQKTGGAGTDTLTGFENLTGSAFDDLLTGTLGDNIFDGGDGNDVVSYANAKAAVSIDLSAANPHATGGGGKDTLISIEGLIGTKFNDALIGDDKDNFLEGGLGDDTLTGGLGNDTASYAGAIAGVTVDLTVAGAQNTKGAGTDTLSGIENLIGGKAADTLTGDSKDNVLTGNDGNDTITGGDGNDTIDGGAGNDKMDGGAGTSDTASYANATAGVTVSLLIQDGTTSQKTGGAGTDVLKGFENLTGGVSADVLTGDAKDNVLIGNAGGDTIDGGAGNDLVRGGTGSDKLDGGADTDTLDYSDITITGVRVVMCFL
jgi:Ca2+-binding RTX toxin-like protein